MLFGSNMLEIAVGLVLVYWLFSLVCSTIVELIAGSREWRGQALEATLKSLVGKLGTDLLAHPLVAKVDDEGGRKASYLSSESFTRALLAVVQAKAEAAPDAKPVGSGPSKPAELRALVAKIGDTELQRLLLSLIDDAEADLAGVRLRIAHWFDAAMDRVTGSYRRKTQRWTFGIAFAVSLLANVDTLAITGALRADPETRAKVTIAAEAVIQRQQAAPAAPPAADATKPLEDAIAEMKGLDLPVGWTKAQIASLGSFAGLLHFVGQVFSADGLRKLLGLLLTTVALTLGAPFWFDLLNRLVNARSAGAKPQRSPPAAPPASAPGPAAPPAR
jgi:hypothetical protein